MPVQSQPSANAKTLDLPSILVDQDQEVIAKVLAGDGARFEVLMRRHNERVYRTARAILRDEHDVEDAMQRAWVAAFRGLAGFHGNAQFATWLTRITVNEALTQRRQRARVDRVPSLDPSALETRDSSQSSTPDQLVSDDLHALVMDAVQQLPPSLRVVFMLRAVQGLDSRETARSLGIGTTLTRVRYHRARTHLKKALAARADSELAQTFRFYIPRCDRVVSHVLAQLQIAPSPRIRAAVLASLEVG